MIKKSILYKYTHKSIIYNTQIVKLQAIHDSDTVSASLRCPLAEIFFSTLVVFTLHYTLKKGVNDEPS